MWDGECLVIDAAVFIEEYVDVDDAIGVDLVYGFVFTPYLSLYGLSNVK